TANDLRVRLEAFANDSMMGRLAGTVWDAKAADWVAAQFRGLGLRPAGDSGGWFQTVPGIRVRDTSVARAAPRNVIAIVPGTDPGLRGEYVAITAHNDHIGFQHSPVDHDSLRAFNTVARPLGADSPARAPTSSEWVRIRQILDSLRALRPPRPDSVFNGADDDGSGTVALIEIAEAFAKGSLRPRRSILLVSHTAEEEGLRGSAWYTDHATVPLDSIVAEIDLDMIGRGAANDIKAGGPTYLEVVGLRRLSNEFGDWVEAVNARQPLPFVFDFEYDAPGHPDQYYCRADHYSYARYGIPSVSLSRGSHMDYHQLTDEPQYIDYPDYTRLTKMVFDAALFVANADHAPRLSVPKPVNPHVPCRQ
ncbi:MAG TPA: M28 family peptidase, partial [Gemmatimonadaceae bacterium]|nr:M28 family peptidase [Gemmatimonadaceae bacterium]